jgi:hypothetical protein
MKLALSALQLVEHLLLELLPVPDDRLSLDVDDDDLSVLPDGETHAIGLPEVQRRSEAALAAYKAVSPPP